MKDSLDRGIHLYHTRQYRLALNEFQEINLVEKKNPQLYYFMGLCLTKLEQYDDALLYLEQVVQMDLSILQIYQARMVLGYIYSVTRRYKLAEFEFKQIIESGLESSQVYAAYGYILYFRKKLISSVQVLRKALDIDPNNSTALNSLGYILAEENIDAKEALDLCRKAVKLKPLNVSYLDSLGWTHFKNGRIPEAVKFLKKAYRLASGNKEIAVHLKVVLQEEQAKKNH